MEPPLENVHIGSGAVPLSGVMTRDSLGGGSPRQAGAQAVISGAPGIRPGASGSIRLQGGQLRNGRKAGRLCPSGGASGPSLRALGGSVWR